MIFVCAVITVVLHALSTVILCVEGGLGGRNEGRVLLAEKDAALARSERAAAKLGAHWTGLDDD
jgi:hypothetical protein